MTSTASCSLTRSLNLPVTTRRIMHPLVRMQRDAMRQAKGLQTTNEHAFSSTSVPDGSFDISLSSCSLAHPSLYQALLPPLLGQQIIPTLILVAKWQTGRLHHRDHLIRAILVFSRPNPASPTPTINRASLQLAGKTDPSRASDITALTSISSLKTIHRVTPPARYVCDLHVIKSRRLIPCSTLAILCSWNGCRLRGAE